MVIDLIGPHLWLWLISQLQSKSSVDDTKNVTMATITDIQSKAGDEASILFQTASTMSTSCHLSPSRLPGLFQNQEISIFFKFNDTFCFGFAFFAFSAALAAHGGSQARGYIGAAVLHQSHSNVRSEPCLQPTPQLSNAGSLAH